MVSIRLRIGYVANRFIVFRDDSSVGGRAQSAAVFGFRRKLEF
jgi:hypothetical protein